MDSKQKINRYTSNIILGLDIGKTSVGFALVDKNNDYKIINAGVRLFDAPEDPSKQESLSKQRGKYKRGRNSNANEFLRTKNVVKTMLKYGILDAEIIRKYDKSPKVKDIPKSKKKHLFYIKTAEYLFYKKSNKNDILSLRFKALYYKLSSLELARLLYSMNKHRGITYDEIKKTSASSDLKNLKNGIENYTFQYKSNEESYLSVGEFLYKNHKDKFRNKEKTSKLKKNINNYYLFSIPRDDLKREIEVIFEKQREFGNQFASKEFQDEYLKHFLWEKESPTYDTLVAPCKYNPSEKSANKHHFSSQLYIALEKLYNIRLREIDTKEYLELTQEQKKTILKNSFEKSKSLSYKDIKKLLNLSNMEFKGVLDENMVLINFNTFIDIKKIFKLEFNPIKEFMHKDGFIHNDLVKIIEILAYETKDSIKIEKLSQLNISNENIEKLLKIKVRGHLSYSLGVVNKLCLYMLDGYTPHDAKEKIKDDYGVKSIEKTAYLPPVLDTDFPLQNNHAVIRALSQVRVVINDILKHYKKVYNNQNWTFDSVTIELARELNSETHKKKYENIQKENTKANQEAKEFCEKYNLYNPNYNQILKAKLWIMQNGIDPYVWIQNNENKNIDSYTLGRMDAERLFDEDYCQIEHTLPILRSLDDSQSNKTLVFAKTNQDKGDKTPYEWLSKDAFEKLESYLGEKKIKEAYGDARIRKLLNKDFKGIDGFKQRDIKDTQIISKYAGLYIDTYLKFWNNPNFDGKRRVYANNGKITSILRRAWAIGKKNRDTYLHHAQDAILIACSTPALIKTIATFINIQHKLPSDNLTKEKFHKIFEKHKSIKEYILQEIEKQNIDIENLDTSTLFKLIANKSYPYDGFREDFKNIIANAPVTHYVKQKTNGTIHDDTIYRKKSDNDRGIEVRNGIARNGKFIRYDLFKIVNSKGKVTYDFIVLTAQYHGKKVEDLPLPTLKDGKTSTFMFSVYKYDLLQILYKQNAKSEQITLDGLFWKKPSSVWLINDTNVEDSNFKRQIESLSFNVNLPDDMINKKSYIQELKEISFSSLSSKKKIKAIADEVLKVKNKIISILPNNYKILFTFKDSNIKQTQELKKYLINENIVEETIQEKGDIIYIDLIENKYLPASIEIGTTKIKGIKKLKRDCLGNIIDEITQEIRKPLV